MSPTVGSGPASEHFFRLAIEAAPTGMLMIDQQGRIVLINAQVEKLLGYSREELLGQPLEMLVPERFRAKHPHFRTAFLEAPRARPMGGGRDLFGLRKDGSEVPIEIGLTPLETPEGTFVLSSIVDITERKRAAAHIHASLREKETLLKEVHHRVKNNLQVISSLINMQMRSVSDASTRGALAECQARIRSIALIHESLYRSKDFSSIPFSEYARSLASNVLHATGPASSSVALELRIEPVSLTVDKAIPCGLILNELLTNAFKHAFPAERRGKIVLELRRASEHEVLMSVTDDGVGLPAALDLERASSLGMQLVRTLVEQLEGRITLGRQGGASIIITFPAEQAP